MRNRQGVRRTSLRYPYATILGVARRVEPAGWLIGGLAQSGERLLCKQEVRGSNPLASTTVSDTANAAAQGDFSGVLSPYGTVLRGGDGVDDRRPAGPYQHLFDE